MLSNLSDGIQLPTSPMPTVDPKSERKYQESTIIHIIYL